MAKIVLLNKPFQVLSQFREHESKTTLASFVFDKSLRLAGRLDFDSEGLLVFTDDGKLASGITDPKYKRDKTYWAQVEGDVAADALEQLQGGVALKDGRTRPAQARKINAPADLWERDPPIRYRADIPTSWIELTIHEGRNRQVRRMTAAVGHPTLRLIRMSVADWQLDGLQPGELRVVS